MYGEKGTCSIGLVQVTNLIQSGCTVETRRRERNFGESVSVIILHIGELSTWQNKEAIRDDILFSCASYF